MGWCCAREGGEPSSRKSPGLPTQDGMPRTTQLNPFPQQGSRRSLPVTGWLSCQMMGQGKAILMPSSVFDRRNDTVGKQCLSPAEGGNINDCFSVFHSRFPWSPRDISRESKEGRERDALGWCSNAELGCPPGTGGAYGKRAAQQRDSSAQSAAGLRALPAGTKGRGARQREVKGSVEWEDG